MKKMILSLMGAILGCTTFAANCVSVKQIDTDYTGHKITIALTRTDCTGDNTNHRNTVWVFVDYRETGSSSWTRATINTVSAGTVINSGNSKGAWIYGANGTQTVTLTLSGMPTKYDWCAFATDYPPNATMSSGTYQLKGSPPFTINNSVSVSAHTHTGACIAAITDQTGCPGIINYPNFTAGALSAGTWGSVVRRGEFLNTGGQPIAIVSSAATGGSGIFTYQWFKNSTAIAGATSQTYLPPKSDAAAAGTFTYTRKDYDNTCHTAGTAAAGSWVNVVGGPVSTFTGCAVHVARYDITQLLTAADGATWCADITGDGWRLPTKTELQSCFCNYFSAMGLIQNFPVYFSSTTGNTGSGNWYFVANYAPTPSYFERCHYNYTSNEQNMNTPWREGRIRCVKNK